MKKVLISILAFVLISVLASIIYNACKPCHYVVYNVDNVVILKTNDMYEYYQFQKGLNEKNVTYTTVCDGVAR